MRALSFGLVQIMSDNTQVIREINLGWTREKAINSLRVAMVNNTGNLRVAVISLDYLGMGSMRNFKIEKVL